MEETYKKEEAAAEKAAEPLRKKLQRHELTTSDASKLVLYNTVSGIAKTAGYEKPERKEFLTGAIGYIKENWSDISKKHSEFVEKYTKLANVTEPKNKEEAVESARLGREVGVLNMQLLRDVEAGYKKTFKTPTKEKFIIE